jgi:hypothetical protein
MSGTKMSTREPVAKRAPWQAEIWKDFFSRRAPFASLKTFANGLRKR